MDNTKLHTVDAVGDHTIGAVRILTDQGIQIAGCYVPGTERNNEADAAEIVRRWNAHAALVAALERAIESLEIGAGDSEEAGYPSRAEAMRNDAQVYRTTLEAIKATAP